MKNVHMCYMWVTEGKIENMKKERKMRISILTFIYTIQFAYLKVYTKFHNPKLSHCWENWRKISICVIKEWQKENWKRRQMSFSDLIFIYTIHLAYLKVYTKFENTGCDRTFYWREKKRTNKRTNMLYVTLFCYTKQLITIKHWPRKYAHSSFSSLVQSLLPKDTLLRTYLTS